MASLPNFSTLRTTMIVVLTLGALTVLFLMYFKSFPSPKCHPPPAHWAELTKQADIHSMSLDSPPEKQELNKSVVLVWFWPDEKRFDLHDCKKHFNIDNCHLTDDRALSSKAHAVLVFHKAIDDELSNLPTSRTRFQRWIWFNMDSPTNTRRIPGLKSLFNLTLSYRRDSDIHVRWRVTARKATDKEFVVPEKERLVCWIVESKDLKTKLGERYTYFMELAKHINVDLFESSSDELKGEKYFSTISSCKFFLSFENSIHRDYITETFSGPLAAGTVPVALGPPRTNYENFVPGSSFIHINDFHDAAALAKYLLQLDKDNQTYMRYFDWWKYYTLKQPFTEEKYKYAHAICQACLYVGRSKDFRVVPDLYKWFLMP